MKTLKNALLVASAISGIVVASTPADAITIVLRPDDTFTTVQNGAAALYAFQKAANYFNKTLSGVSGAQNINISVSFAALRPGVLGQAGSARYDMSAASVYQALSTNAAGALDASAVNSLVPLSAAGGVGFRRAPASGGTDFYDYYGGKGAGAKTGTSIAWDNESVLSVLDLFRRSSNGGGAGFDPATANAISRSTPIAARCSRSTA